MKPIKKAALFSVLLILLALMVLLLLSFQKQYLFLSEFNSGKVLFCTEISDGGYFSISFMHSVNKSPVTEIYRIEEGQICLEELRYKTFGAGMPSQPEESQVMVLEGEDLVIRGYGRIIPDLCYVPGFAANHILRWSEGEIPLSSLTDKVQPVLFSVDKHPCILALLGIHPKTNR